eukprot:gnl/Spiro4/25198_TR12539_c0_g1_i1.p1 gnl/Spiro4/25198_TR12539_c0_g1~~gnl/Spiro4/25198_TR12539_c0_g1_i1.p1  ORF type:complete len:236 (+),score=12.14 gnl/Spiro4/25198_TR12539_c0_g1_i1:31-708(+)
MLPDLDVTVPLLVVFQDDDRNGCRQPQHQASSIETPQFKLRPSLTQEGVQFERPTNYLRHTAKTQDSQIEYDLESDDERFLSVINRCSVKINVDMFEHTIDCLEKALHKDTFDLATVSRENNIPLDVITRIEPYWRDKRGRIGKSLIQRFQNNRAEENAGNRRPRRKTTLGKSRHRYLKMLKLRQEFERLRMLVDLVRKRELCKRARVSVAVSLETAVLRQFCRS